MGKVQLHLLERPLHDEWRIRVDDRPQPFERQARPDPCHQLLADADIDDTLRMPANGAGFTETGHANVGQHDGDSRVGIE